jgi:hypothetical protein
MARDTGVHRRRVVNFPPPCHIGARPADMQPKLEQARGHVGLNEGEPARATMACPRQVLSMRGWAGGLSARLTRAGVVARCGLRLHRCLGLGP